MVSTTPLNHHIVTSQPHHTCCLPRCETRKLCSDRSKFLLCVSCLTVGRLCVFTKICACVFPCYFPLVSVLFTLMLMRPDIFQDMDIIFKHIFWTSLNNYIQHFKVNLRHPTQIQVYSFVLSDSACFCITTKISLCSVSTICFHSIFNLIDKP